MLEAYIAVSTRELIKKKYLIITFYYRHFEINTSLPIGHVEY